VVGTTGATKGNDPMGASDSNLSAAGYGYDYVVTVSQMSINATALAYLSDRQPAVNVCYVYDANWNPVPIDYQELIRRAKGTDPFRVPESGPEHDTALKNLDDANFVFGFSAAMGLPAGVPVASLPDVVTLGGSAEVPVVYRLFCRTFQLVELQQRPHNAPPGWRTWSQPSGQMWLFSYDVPLIAGTVENTATFVGTAPFDNLPQKVQEKVSAQPEDFTIKHLLFDFAHASATTRPEISGVDRDLKEKLEADFSIAYFAQLQGISMPVVAVIPSSSADPFAGLQTEFEISPNAADPSGTMLDYLCAVAGSTLPPAKPFTWDWLDKGQIGTVDGVCVVNRDHLAAHLHNQLAPYVEANKWLTQPAVVKVYFKTWDFGFGVVGRHHDWGSQGTPDNLVIDVETAEMPATGELLLHTQFHATRTYEWLRGSSWCEGKTAFEVKVSCHGNVITVEQHALVNCDLTIISTQYGCRLVDLTLVDTITLAVQHDGTLATTQTTTRQDNSEPPTHSILLPDLQRYLTDVKKTATASITSTMIDVPLQLADQVIFPGSKGFQFSDVFFSDHQDLVAHIQYVDPT
jgi:hypothetical protein